MKDLIKELKRKKQEELDYQMQISADVSFKTATEYNDLSNELKYSDGKVQQIDDIIFFLEEGAWEDEVEHTIQVVRSHE